VNVAELSGVVFSGALAAGFLGALTGLGGGVIVIPLLTLGLGVDIRYAAGAALVSVIATSSGAASAYVREGYTNLRVGMLLEVFTSIGAVLGAMLAAHTPVAAIALLLGVVLLASAAFSLRPHAEPSQEEPPDPLAVRLRLDASFPTPSGPRAYRVHRVPAGAALMFVAGILSGLLGIGSGAVKVLALDVAMRLPFKVSTTTSNFMIGVTAAASAGVYLGNGFLDPALAMPVMLGVLGGSLLGARMLERLHWRTLRAIFALLIAALGVQLIVNALSGRM
jgi:uncharacterized membrane protein YfcA